jgi:L,D-transpeptidase YbiS
MMTAKLIIKIIISSQKLYLINEGQLISTYQVSTSRYGTGQKKNSYQTPLGLHVIRAKIGINCPKNAVFKARRWSGELYDSDDALDDPILTRIMWLSGLELGYNRSGTLDTMRRYIYIHGTPDINMIGKPMSMGCVRMSSDDVIDLFNMVQVGTRVEVVEHEDT